MKLQQWLSSYSNWLIRRSWWIILSSIVFTIMIAIGAKYLRVNGDVNIYFSKDNPQLQALEEIHSEYEKTDNVIIVLEPKGGDVFTKEHLVTLEKIANESWKAPYVTRVDALSNFQHIEAKEDLLNISDLVEDAHLLSEKEIADIKRIALAEKSLVKRLLSPSGHVAGIALTVQFPKKDFLSEGPELVSYIEQLTSKYENENMNIRLTGTVLVDHAFSTSGEKDMSTLIPLMFLVIMIVIFIFFRSITSTLATIMIVFLSTAIALGVFGFMGLSLNPTTSSAPTMIMTIVIADCIHFITTIVMGLRKGMTKQEAIKDSIISNFKPILLTSVTTMVGYLSMNLSASPPFRELGNLVAIGVFAGCLFSLYLLPALINALPFNYKKKEGRYYKIFDVLPNYLIRNKKKVAAASFSFCLLISLGVYNNQINDMFLDFFDDDFEIIKDTRFTVDNLTGVYSIEYSLGSGEDGGITDPEYLKLLEDFENWFYEQDKVIHVSSFAESIRRLNRVMNEDKAEFDKIPEDGQLISQYLFLYEMSLPFGRGLNHEVNMEKSATRFKVIFENMYTKDLRDIELAASNWLKNNAPEHMYFDGSSTSVMFRYLSEQNIDFMLSGFGTAVFAIALMIIVTFRSIKIGLMSLIPNILPSLVAFGIWGIFVGEIGLAVAFVTSITLGIVVDDTIHFLSKYLNGRRELSLSPEDAIRYTFSKVGASLYHTSLVLICGFIVLIFSPFQLNSSMGVLCAMTIILALVLDYILLPVLLLTFDKDKSVRPKEGKGANEILKEKEVQLEKVY